MVTPAPSTSPQGPGTGPGGELADHLDRDRTAFVPARFLLTDLRDIGAAVERTRRMLDADCDPVAVDDAFAGDPVIGPLVRQRPGLRVPGHPDGNDSPCAPSSGSRSASPVPARSRLGS